MGSREFDEKIPHGNLIVFHRPVLTDINDSQHMREVNAFGKENRQVVSIVRGGSVDQLNIQCRRYGTAFEAFSQIFGDRDPADWLNSVLSRRLMNLSGDIFGGDRRGGDHECRIREKSVFGFCRALVFRRGGGV